MAMNPFRILADVCHTLSKCILIWTIHSNKSAEGVSLITQALYALVFCTRYLDLLASIIGPIFSLWNFTLKIFYIVSSLYILYLMLRVYARTREREKAWKLGGACLGGSALLAPVVMMLFEKKFMWGFAETLWTFSIILESACILPQLLLLRQTTVPTVLTSFYLLTLGSYRGFYILNWIWRGLDSGSTNPDAVSIIFGIIQTALYVDFAWVYWGRQRVKLRNGGVVDQDDFERGWFLTRILGQKGPRQLRDDEHSDDGGDAERGGVDSRGRFDGADGDGNLETNGRTNKASNKWGARGISVSADDGLFGEDDSAGVHPARQNGMRNPDKMQRVLDDDEDDDRADLLAGTPVGDDAAEWRDGAK